MEPGRNSKRKLRDDLNACKSWCNRKPNMHEYKVLLILYLKEEVHSGVILLGRVDISLLPMMKTILFLL